MRPDEEILMDSTTAISNNTNSVMDTDSLSASHNIPHKFSITPLQ